MRLTLRTLLAYLDDTLEPAESLEIGRKVAENEQARELMDRIKKSVRKRSLAVPVSHAAGDTSDANTVAQYLSDTLTPDLVAHFEKVCLEHDLNLAEAAACHQILTLLQAEQIRIPPATRRRMYDLAEEPMALPNRKPGRAVSIASVYDESRHEDRGEDDAYLMGLSAMSRRDPARLLTIRLVLAASLLSLFAFSAYMVWPTVPETAREPISYATVVPTGKPSDLPTTAATSAPLSIAKNEVAPLPRTPTNDAKPEPKVVTTPMPEATPKELPPVPPADATRAEIGKFERRDVSPAIVVRNSGGNSPYELVMPDEPKQASTDRLTVLPGYKATFKLDTDVAVELWGNLPELSNLSPVREASFTPTLPAGGVDADLTLHTGRFYIGTKKPKGAAIRLRIGSLVWDVALLNDSAAIAVEVGRTLLPGLGEPRTTWTAGLHVVQGQVDLFATRTTKLKLTRGQEAFWNSTDDKTTQPPALKSDPSRATYFSKFPTPIDPRNGKSILELLEKFSKDVTNKDRLREAFSVAFDDKTDGQTPEQVQRTTTAVTMFAALGELNAMSDAINDPTRMWVRGAAVQGLRSVFAADPDNIEKFREVLKTKPRLTEDLADEVILLLRGFADEERGNPLVLDRLLKDMENAGATAIPVRELAFQTLVGLLDPTDPKIIELRYFDAAGTREARGPVVAAWTKKVEELKKAKSAAPPVPKP